ncbi:MAG: SpaA isopeptide-forming pilin-related protein, partial [Peptostreptococcaceae bacterium]|nr:SpaA isopeptide-forming pilin-related protein [Peptostreptococcaceae bacterium]
MKTRNKWIGAFLLLAILVSLFAVPRIGRASDASDKLRDVNKIVTQNGVILKDGDSIDGNTDIRLTVDFRLLVKGDFDDLEEEAEGSDTEKSTPVTESSPAESTESSAPISENMSPKTGEGETAGTSESDKQDSAAEQTAPSVQPGAEGSSEGESASAPAEEKAEGEETVPSSSEKQEGTEAAESGTPQAPSSNEAPVVTESQPSQQSSPEKPTSKNKNVPYVREGDTAVIDLGTGLRVKQQDIGRSLELIGKGVLPQLGRPAKVGTVMFENDSDGKLIAKITFDGDDIVFNGELSEVFANFQVAFDIDKDKVLDEGGQKFLDILGKRYTVVYPVYDPSLDVSKKGVANPKNRTITWTVEVQGKTSSNVDLTGYQFKDDLTQVGKYIDSSLQVNGVSQTPDGASSESLLLYTFPQDSKGKQTIVFQTALEDKDVFKQVTVSKSNKAEILYNDVVKADGQATLDIPRQVGWISKGAGNPIKGDKDGSDKTNYYLDWRITVNGPEFTGLKNVKIYDKLPEGLAFVRAQWYDFNPATNNYDIPVGEEITQQPSELPLNSKESAPAYILPTLDKKMRLIITTKAVNSAALDQQSKTFYNTAYMEWDGSDRFQAGDARIIGKAKVSKRAVERVPGSSKIKWQIGVNKDNLPQEDPKMFDVFIFDDYNGKVGHSQIKNLTGFPAGYAPVDFEPVYLSYQRYVDGSFSGGALNAQVHPLYFEGTHVGDLLEVSGSRDVDWLFTVETEPMTYRFNLLPFNDRNLRIWLNNTAFLFGDKQLIDKRNTAIEYFNRMLEKEMIQGEFIPQLKDSPTADLANMKVANKNSDEGKKSGFNPNTGSVIYRLSINGDNHSQLIRSLGSLKLEDQLPAGWEFVKISGDRDYLAFRANPIPHSIRAYPPSFPLTDPNELICSVEAKGEPVAIAGLNTNDFIGTSKAEFNFTADLDGPYVILLEARPTAEKMREYFKATASGNPAVGLKDRTAKNTATLSSPKRLRGGPSAEQEVVADARILEKSQIVSQPGELKWTVDFRPYSLTEDSDTVGIKDKLSEGMELKRDEDGNLDFAGDNMKLYELILSGDGQEELGPEVELKEGSGGNISYNHEERVLDLTFPSKEKAYRFIYKTDIKGNPGQNVRNTVSLVGINLQLDPKSAFYQISNADAGASYQINSSIEVFKTDEQGKPLPKAEFTLTYAGDKGKQIKTTSQRGIAKFSRLPEGKHILKETAAPKGYQINPKEYEVIVTKKSNVEVSVEIVGSTGSDPSKITIVNKKETLPPPNPAKAEIEVLKTDEQGHPLADAEFALVYGEGKGEQKKKTPQNGTLRFTDVPEGSHILKETAAPQGYKADLKEYPVIVTKQSDGSLKVQIVGNTSSDPDKITIVNKKETPPPVDPGNPPPVN